MARKLAWLMAVAVVILDVVLVTSALRGAEAPRPAQASARNGIVTIFPAPEMVRPTRLSTGPAARTPAPAGSDAASVPEIAAPGAPAGAPVVTTLTAPAPATSSGIQVLGESRTEEPTTSRPPVTPAPRATPGQDAAESPAAGRVLLGVSRDGLVIRAIRGACPAAVATAVAVSLDGGRTFRQASFAAPQVLRVGAAGGEAWLIGVDSSCRPIQRHTDDGGAHWDDGRVSDSWYLSPDADAAQVVGPGTVAEVGCVPLAVAGIDARRAVVACADGDIRATKDAGDAWSTIAALPGVVSLALTSAEDGYALAAAPDCPARVLRTVDGGRTWRPAACIAGAQPRAIAADGDVVAAQVGTRLFVSADAGRAWRLASD